VCCSECASQRVCAFLRFRVRVSACACACVRACAGLGLGGLGRQISGVLGLGEVAGYGGTLLCLSLYFGILSRDCAEMCTVMERDDSDRDDSDREKGSDGDK
jgi:hypothetical protein